MRKLYLFGLTALLLAAWTGDDAVAQNRDGTGLRIEWEVKNRFRLFRSEADFQRHVAAYRGDGLLAAEGRLARASDGRGWARDTVERLCTDRAGKLLEFCDRDGVREVYLSPRDHRVGVVLAGVQPNLNCVWRFEDGESEPREATVPCDEEIRLRALYGKTTVATVDVVLPDGTAQRVVADIVVRDVLMAGMGDSVAAGEGNPDRAVRLADDGFCFRRFILGATSEYYLPGRAGFHGNKSCSGDTGESSRANEWALQSARWASGPCHRSLYSYQLRTALALAVENPHIAVTYIPLACSGSTINVGFLTGQRIRECANPGATTACPGTTRPQIVELVEALEIAHRHSSDRKLDTLLLTIGANDVHFSGLVANIIIEARTERLLFNRGVIASVDDAQKVLDESFPADFNKVRAALKPLVGGSLARVVFVSYGHPALAAPDTPCTGGRAGFDVHPSFAADSGRLREISDFVAHQFLPKMKAIATCAGRLCRDPANDRMTFVDSHQPAFAGHGVCARADDDPEFDRRCFSIDGKSFDDNPATAATSPMTCRLAASEYRPYAPRKRWIRTANDSYFTSMTYPQGLASVAQPTNIHDATWGILSAVYGGAIHPTAEGHAVMAEAAITAVRNVLGIKEPPARGQVGSPFDISVPQQITPIR